MRLRTVDRNGDVSDMNSRQWRVYDWLKANAVGKANTKTRRQVAAAFPDEYPANGDGVQEDIRVIRQTVTRRIESSNAGYWLPLNGGECVNFLASKALGHLWTAITNGQLPIDRAYAFLNAIRDEARKPMDEQIRMVLGDYERDTVKVFSDDLVREKDPDTMTDDELRDEYLSLGGCCRLVRADYVKEIRALREERDGRGKD